MSFSSNVKNELSRHYGSSRHCNIAEIAAILNMCGQITEAPHGFMVKIQTENVAVARKYFTLLKKTFNIDSDILIRRNSQLNKNRVYMLYLRDSRLAEKVLLATGLLQRDRAEAVIRNRISSLVVSASCCKRAYIRGAFLASGSVADPEKTYHLEFVTADAAYGRQLRDLINSFDLDAKIVKRKEHYVVYLKEGDQIVNLLNIMEAHVALMELENVRILKDMRNNVNRIVNCETANLNKTISAAIQQLEDIQYLAEHNEIAKLPPALRSVAEARMEQPDASLKELGESLNPPVGKSGVNHRLRKLSELADTLRTEKGEGLC
mgnify:CR=1 FL=1